MEAKNTPQNKRRLSPINTEEWLAENDLTNLTNEFVSKNINIESLMKMDTNQLNKYLTDFSITEKDKIKLRSKLHHLRLISQYSHSRPASYNPEIRSPKIYNRNHVKSLTDILNHKDEHLLNQLVNHQNIIQKLITYCLNSSNLLNQNVETSLVLIENEFNNIINAVNNKKIEIVSKLNQIKAQKFDEINKYALQLKQYQKVSFLTMNSCMQLLNGQEKKTYQIQTMVDNLLNHQTIPTNANQLNINCNIDVRFNYQSQLSQFLSSICSVNEQPMEQKQQLPIINDLEVTDITETTAMLKWNGMLSENDEKHNDIGWYIDLNISDIDYETKHNGIPHYVLKKKFKLDKNNAIYSINLAGLQRNNSYKVILNINDGKHKCFKKIFKQFKTKKKQKGFAFNIPKKFITQKNVNRFLVTNNGKTVLLNQYDSGTIVYGKYLNCNNNNNENEWDFNSVTMKLINTSPSGFGVGFATNEFNEFDGWNTGQNSSVIVYGNGEFYSSQEFMSGNSKYSGKHGSKLFQLDFMRRNDIITVIVNYKLRKLQIINVTQNDKLELNLNTNDIEKIAIILWFGWTNGQSVSISNQKLM